MLLWWPQGKQRELTLVDPFEGRDLWRGRKFAANARACVVNDEVVGVMEPSGRFVLVSLPDGRTIADLKLEAEPSLIDISLDASGERQYLLLVSSSRGEANAPAISAHARLLVQADPSRAAVRHRSAGQAPVARSRGD